MTALRESGSVSAREYDREDDQASELLYLALMVAALPTFYRLFLPDSDLLGLAMAIVMFTYVELLRDVAARSGFPRARVVTAIRLSSGRLTSRS
jgi:hypothetical protein